MKRIGRIPPVTLTSPRFSRNRAQTAYRLQLQRRERLANTGEPQGILMEENQALRSDSGILLS